MITTVNSNRLYYIGSSEVAKAFVKGEEHRYLGSLEQKTEEATKRVQKGEDGQIIIVKIVRVIRRTTPPVVVEDIEPKVTVTHGCPYCGGADLSHYNDTYIQSRVHYRCNQCGRKHYTDEDA